MKESIALNDQNGTETDCCHHWRINDGAAAATAEGRAAADPLAVAVTDRRRRDTTALPFARYSAFVWTVYPNSVQRRQNPLFTRIPNFSQ